MEKHERLKAAWKRAGYSSAAEAARAMDMIVSTFVSHQNGTRDFNEQDAARYARKFRVSAEWLIFGSGDPEKNVPLDTIPVKGEVRAGAWLEIDGSAEPEEHLPMTPDPAWARVPQFALKVVGTSMNKVAPPGSYVIVASWPELGAEVQDNDLLVVRRERGMTYEVTLKRARRGKKGWELWPESSDPRWQEPVSIDDGDSDVSVMVVGKVIGKYERLS